MPWRPPVVSERPQSTRMAFDRLPWIAPRSIRRCLSFALELRRFAPPGKIVGEARKGTFERLARVADGLARVVQSLGDGADGDRARDDGHSHLGKRAVPGEVRARAAHSPGRI